MEWLIFLGVRSDQVVILKARPAMDAAVVFFHLSLSPTSSSSLTRFRPVVMPYHDKLALFKTFPSFSFPWEVQASLTQTIVNEKQEVD